MEDTESTTQVYKPVPYRVVINWTSHYGSFQNSFSFAYVGDAVEFVEQFVRSKRPVDVCGVEIFRFGLPFLALVQEVGVRNEKQALDFVTTYTVVGLKWSAIGDDPFVEE